MLFLPLLSSGIVVPSREPSWDDAVPISMKRRDPRIWQLAYVASKRAIVSAGVTPHSVVCGTALGALDETRKYLDGVFTDGFGSPRHFIASVHNSMAGKIAVEFKIDGTNLTVCDGQNSFSSAIVTASLLNSDDYPALLLVVDENIELMKNLLPHLSPQCRRYLSATWNDTAVAFLLGAPSEKSKPCLAAIGPSLCDGKDPAGFLRELAGRTGLNAQELPPLETTSDYFVKPAVITYERLTENIRGDFPIGSYSPSAGAAALVCLCA